jgi:hypothetical protein
VRGAGPVLAELVGALAPGGRAALGEECWYRGDTPLPVQADREGLASSGERFARSCAEAGVARGLVRSVVVCPARFNALVQRWNSKAIVLSLALAELLRDNHGPASDGEPVAVFIDKHGGRNSYAATLQQAVPAGMVIAEEEGAERSTYRVAGLGREVRLTFEPRADAAHFGVALASMVSKYLRELLMLEFNRFWQGHVPGLKPTAGYPGDAGRFFEAIRPAALRLGVPEAALWRCR